MNKQGLKMQDLTDDKGLIETEEIILYSVHDILQVVKAWCEADAKKNDAYEGRVHMVNFCLQQLERLMVPPPTDFN